MAAVVQKELPVQEYWRAEYARQLDQRLDNSIQYLSRQALSNVRAHIRSYLTLLDETSRFPALIQKALVLISHLHPLPLRWGMGYVWEGQLRFALDHIAAERIDLVVEYKCSLAEVYQFRGQFEQAISEAQTVFEDPSTPMTQYYRASGILFTCYRANGQPQKADDVIEQAGRKFTNYHSAADVPLTEARAWLTYQQSRLVQLRERGEVDRALSLVQDMVWLDAREGAPNKSRSAELFTHRSTLLWVRSRYVESVQDLQNAMKLFRDAEEHFNAEALKSNLGLVYWTMGALDEAEKTLLSSIQFYRETGSEHLLTYDIANLGLVYFARGALEEALSLTQQHIALAQKINFVHEYYRGRRNLGTILYYFGEYQRSIEETTASHAYYEKRGSRDAYGLDNLWVALCLHATGKIDRAIVLARDTLEWAKTLQSRVLEQLTLRCIAKFLSGAERETALLASLNLALEMDRKLEEAAVRLALADVYSSPRREKEWQAGTAILREIGAENWVTGCSPDTTPFLPLLL